MIRMLMAVVGVSFAAVAATADDKAKPADTPAAKLAALKKEATESKEVRDAEEKLFKQIDGLAESKDRRTKVTELLNAHEQKKSKWYQAALELAKSDPKSDVGFEALEWIISNQYFESSESIGKPALALMIEHYATDPKVGSTVFLLAQSRRYVGPDMSAPGDPLLKAVAEKNPDKTVRGQVAVARAWEAKGKFEAAEKENQKDADQLAAKAEKAFEAVIKEFGECKLLDTYQKTQPTLAEVSMIELSELRNLRVGKVAPDIEGEDLDGVKFKLSDYRGKVILLDFWGDW